MLLAQFLLGARAADGRYTFSPSGLSGDRFPVATAASYLTVTAGDAVQRGRIWRPDTRTAPQWRTPVILVPSLYSAVADNSGAQWLVERFTPKGYAVAQVDLPGTGRSDGCFDFFGPVTKRALAAWVRTLATAPWSNGKVAAFGFSADGEASSLAAIAGLQGLATAVTIAASSSVYDGYGYLDGVAFLSETFAGGGVLTPSGATAAGGYALLAGPGYQPRDPRCHVENIRHLTDPSGTFSGWFADRDFRRHVADATAPVLVWHSWRDPVVRSGALSGWVDFLPQGSATFITQDVGHRLPQDATGLGAHPLWPDVLHAWFDDHLLQLPTRTSSWPNVQAQAENGSWRAVPSMASLTRRARHEVDATTALPAALDPVGTAVWASHSLLDSLHIAGEPVINLTLTLDQPDAHVMFELREVEPDGDARVIAVGAASVPHVLGSMDSPQPAPIGEPVRVAVRGWPIDVTVPAGSHLELTVSSAHRAFVPAETAVRGAVTDVSVRLPVASSGVEVRFPAEP